MSFKLSHPRLGLINVRILSTARNITARWKSPDLLSITVPAATRQRELDKALRELEPRLLAKRPVATAYCPGWQFETPEMTFTVASGRRPGYFEGSVDRANRQTTLFLPPDATADDMPLFGQWVVKTLKRYSQTHAERILVPRAHDMATQLNVHPASISISYGQRVLGRCNSRGEILLSRNLVFYPTELRELVIAHEFAHLTHMNHSAAFKQLLNTYVDGRLKLLEKKLKTFRLPF